MASTAYICECACIVVVNFCLCYCWLGEGGTLSDIFKKWCVTCIVKLISYLALNYDYCAFHYFQTESAWNLNIVATDDQHTNLKVCVCSWWYYFYILFSFI